MGYLNEEQLKEFGGSNTLEVGQKANVVLISYEPFTARSGSRIPKHIAKNADTGDELEFVDYKFHDEVKKLNDSIVEGVTVIEVECVDNSTKYHDYVLTVKAGAEVKKEETPEEQF